MGPSSLGTRGPRPALRRPLRPHSTGLSDAQRTTGNLRHQDPTCFTCKALTGQSRGQIWLALVLVNNLNPDVIGQEEPERGVEGCRRPGLCTTAGGALTSVCGARAAGSPRRNVQWLRLWRGAGVVGIPEGVPHGCGSGRASRAVQWLWPRAPRGQPGTRKAACGLRSRRRRRGGREPGRPPMAVVLRCRAIPACSRRGKIDSGPSEMATRAEARAAVFGGAVVALLSAALALLGPPMNAGTRRRPLLLGRPSDRAGRARPGRAQG